MSAADKPKRPEQQPRDPAAEMDAAVKKAEDAGKRLHHAEDGPLDLMGDDENAGSEADTPGGGSG